MNGNQNVSAVQRPQYKQGNESEKIKAGLKRKIG